jgi:glycosyltransferase involved in cell wall biosynthesis
MVKMLKNTWRVSRQLKKIEPNLIHSFHYGADYTEPLSARMAGIPWVFTKKNMSWGGGSKRAWKLRSMLAKGIIAQNTDMLTQFYHNRKGVQMIPRGVDTSRFSPQIPDMNLKEKMNTAADSRVIICVANFVPVKGIEILLEAFRLVKKDLPGWVVWCIGDNDNDYGRSIMNWVTENNMGSTIKFSGKQANVRAYLDLAEIFVLPTLDKGEGSPVAMLEAMANGKVVIGAAVPGIKDQLKNYSEHLFIPGNPESLAEKLKVLMSSSSTSNQALGQAFKELVERDFSIQKEIQAHETFYKNILSGNLV